MLGYILMGLGGYLIYRDMKERRNPDDGVLEDGRDRAGGDPADREHKSNQKSNRNRGLTRSGKQEENTNGNIQQDEPDDAGGGPGDDLGGQCDSAAQVDSTSAAIISTGEEEVTNVNENGT